MKKKNLRLTGIAVAAATFVAGIATMSIAATQTNGSDGPLHIWSGNTETLVSPATSMSWDADVLSSPSSTDFNASVVCPTVSTGYRVFLAARGQERNPASWTAFKSGSFAVGKNVLQAALTPSSLTSGTPGQATAKTNGGDFSLGIACTSNSGVLVNEAHYRYITVTPGGSFVAAATADVVTSTPTPTATADPTLTGSIALSATTTAAVNGTLSLSVPANAAATFGSPTLVNNKSTTTGTLPNVTVTDDRVVTRQGWTLSANVADFVNGGVTIGKANLGISPSIVAASTTATGVTAGTATTAGSATYPFTFAEAAANQTVGNSVIGGNLTFVAPQDKAAGTYTSTLTLTLVSK
jgi:hypothetical protein